MLSFDGTDMVVVDADSHVIEPPDAWRGRVAAAFAERVPRLATRDGSDWLVVEDQPFFSYALMSGLVRQTTRLPGLDGPESGRSGREPWSEQIRPGAYAVVDRLADMDADGVDVAVVYPTVGLNLFSLTDRELAAELARGYNRWLAELVGTSPDRLKGVGVVVPGPRSGADIAECHDLGLVEVMVPLELDGRGFADPAWEPVWEHAEACGMPVASHAFAGRSRPGIDSLVEALIDRTAAVERALVALVFGGVFDRHPGLRFVSVENEAGWAASLIDRADVSWRRGRSSSAELPGCARRPGQVFADHVFLTFIHDQTAVDARRVLGPANVLWSTDYPHNSSTWPRSLDSLRAQLRPGTRPDEVARLVGGNAAVLYGLDTGGPQAL